MPPRRVGGQLLHPIYALAAVGLIYWLGRLWIKTSRGEMYDDPLIYAVNDSGCRIIIIAMIATMLAAHFVALGNIVDRLDSRASALAKREDEKFGQPLAYNTADVDAA